MKRTSQIALSGMMSALSLLALLLTIFPFSTYALPPLAGAFLIPLVIDCGKKWAFGAYVAVSLLSLFLVSDIESKMLFIGFFGYYPIIKSVLETLRTRFLEWLMKLSLFNITAVTGYTLLSKIGFSLEEFAVEGVSIPLGGMLLAFLLAGNVIFILYDIGLTRALPLYFSRFQPLLRRIMHR